MLTTYDIRVSTSPTGYKHVREAFEQMAHVERASLDRLVKSTMPKWWQPIQDELWEAMDGGDFALLDAASEVMVSAADLEETMVIQMKDKNGVIFGWDGIDLDEQDPATAALLLMIQMDDEPFQMVRVAGIDEFKETNNGHGEPYYGIGVEAMIETYYPKEWFETNRLVTRPEEVEPGTTKVECDVEVDMRTLVELKGHDEFERYIERLVVKDAHLTDIKVEATAVQDKKIRFHVKAKAER